MKLTGSCHCGSVEYSLDWPEQAECIPARECSCTYCSRFGGTWTSHPDASLVINFPHDHEPEKYRFGTATADFLFCGRCGITVAAVDENSGRPRAVVNIRTLHDDTTLSFERSVSHFDGESTDDRLGRRSRNWIGRVQIVSSAPQR